MKDIKSFPSKAPAFLGSLDDNPKRMLAVVVEGETLLPGFYACETAAGVKLTMHRDKLRMEDWK